ncbi:MAG: phosphate acyltransferase PlsX [Planctomycetota bacterium]
MTRVVLDAMGGDHAPGAILDGVRRSLEAGDLDAGQVALAGPIDQIEPRLAEHGLDRQAIDLHDAPDVLGGSCESPIDAMRKKPRNSIAVGVAKLKTGEADAFLSAGNTGIVVATAKVALQCLEGIRRPAIAVTINVESGPFIIIDAGANPQPKPLHLMQFALMGSAYHRDAFGTAKPRVGLVNIGSESGKGSSLAKEAGQLLRDAPINFVGNVEGVEMYRGACDVVVCDGFTGNVLLKASEGVAEYMLKTAARVMREHEIGPQKMSAILGLMQKNVDYSEYGGAPLLGVEGSVTICHGRSEGPAIANAIRFATKAVGAKLNQHIVSAAREAAISP